MVMWARPGLQNGRWCRSGQPPRSMRAAVCRRPRRGGCQHTTRLWSGRSPCARQAQPHHGALPAVWAISDDGWERPNGRPLGRRRRRSSIVPSATRAVGAACGRYFGERCAGYRVQLAGICRRIIVPGASPGVMVGGSGSLPDEPRLACPAIRLDSRWMLPVSMATRASCVRHAP
jgi:hypothetical protein